MTILFPISAHLLSSKHLEDKTALDQKRSSLQTKFGMLALLSLILLGSATNFIGKKVVDPAMRPMEENAKTYIMRTLALAGVSYGAARLIDRGISMASETEVTVPVVGGVAFKPFQFLKPIQDMAVRFSDLMVLAMISLGIQLLIMDLGKVAAVPLLLSALSIIWIISLFSSYSWHSRLRAVARLAAILAIAGRLAIPAVAFGVSFISETVLETQRQENQQTLDLTSDTAHLMETAEDPNEGLKKWVSSIFGKVTDVLAAAGKFSENLINAFITLSVIYITETIIAPIGILFLLWRLGKNLLPPVAGTISQEMSMIRADMQTLQSRNNSNFIAAKSETS